MGSPIKTSFSVATGGSLLRYRSRTQTWHLMPVAGVAKAGTLLFSRFRPPCLFLEAFSAYMYLSRLEYRFNCDSRRLLCSCRPLREKFFPFRKSTAHNSALGADIPRTPLSHSVFSSSLVIISVCLELQLTPSVRSRLNVLSVTIWRFLKRESCLFRKSGVDGLHVTQNAAEKLVEGRRWVRLAFSVSGLSYIEGKPFA